jgi:hypothetical protein
MKYAGYQKKDAEVKNEATDHLCILVKAAHPLELAGLETHKRLLHRLQRNCCNSL